MKDRRNVKRLSQDAKTSCPTINKWKRLGILPAFDQHLQWSGKLYKEVVKTTKHQRYLYLTRYKNSNQAVADSVGVWRRNLKYYLEAHNICAYRPKGNYTTEEIAKIKEHFRIRKCYFNFYVGMAKLGFDCNKASNVHFHYGYPEPDKVLWGKKGRFYKLSTIKRWLKKNSIIKGDK